MIRNNYHCVRLEGRCSNRFDYSQAEWDWSSRIKSLSSSKISFDLSLSLDPSLINLCNSEGVSGQYRTFPAQCIISSNRISLHAESYRCFTVTLCRIGNESSYLNCTMRWLNQKDFNLQRERERRKGKDLQWLNSSFSCFKVYEGFFSSLKQLQRKLSASERKL